MPDTKQRIADNLARIRGQIREAARRSGRREEEVTLVAVTKYVDIEQILGLVQAGCGELAESRPQHLWSKAEALERLPLGMPLRWHLVGHLQRNKVQRTLPLVSLIHSVDSLRLLESVDRFSAQLGRTTSVLLEVNISGDVAKHGFPPQEVDAVVARLPAYRHVQMLGLMSMAALKGGRDRARENFARLRQLRDRLRPNCPDGVSLEQLSMGMSADFDLAIAEGATLVRIGTALFEGVIP